MTARSTLLLLTFTVALSAQESKPTGQQGATPVSETASLTAADRIDVLKAELETLQDELLYLKELKAKGGMLPRIKKSLLERKLTYRVFGEGQTASDVAKPKKATFMDPKDFREGSLDMVLLVNGTPIMRQDIDELVFYLKSYPRPEKHRQVMTLAVTAMIKLKAVEAAFASSIPSAHKRMENIQKRLQAGEDFGELAATMSQAESSGRRGEMDPIGRTGSDPLLTMHAFSLKEGDVSEIFQTLRGFEIIKVLEHIRGNQPTEDKVRIQTIVASFVGGPEGQPELQQVLDGVRQGRIDLRMRDRSYSRFFPEIYKTEFHKKVSHK